MLHLMHEELARAHLHERLRRAEQQRQVLYAVRLAKAQRVARRAERAHQRAQYRLQLLTS